MHKILKDTKLRRQILIVGSLCLVLALCVLWADLSDATEGKTRRELHKWDIFTQEEKEKGWILLHVVGMFYMFLAISITCDEYFVPALEELVQKLKIKPEIAGATFMAAGGSAPELFTSFIGCAQKSDVGFGTIVGSAVFNVLFVIGMCAIYSTEPLKLTMWPFFRDSVYYIIALVTLAICFGADPSVGSKIYWYEALILLLLYVGYCLVMKNNSYLKIKFNRLTKGKRKKPHCPVPRKSLQRRENKKKLEWINFKVMIHGISRITKEETNQDICYRFGKFIDSEIPKKVENQNEIDINRARCRLTEEFPDFKNSWLDTKNVTLVLAISRPEFTDHIISNVQPFLDLNDEKNVKVWQEILQLPVKITSIGYTITTGQKVMIKHCGAAFRVGLLNALYNANFKQQIEFAVINLIDGDVRQTFEYFDKDNSGLIDITEFKAVVAQLIGRDLSPEEMEHGFSEIDSDNNGTIDIEEFRSWYFQHCSATNSRAERELKKMKTYYSDIQSKDNSAPLTKPQFETLCEKLQIIAEAFEDARCHMMNRADGYPTRAQYEYWCAHHIRIETGEEEEESIFGIFMKIIVFPIVCILGALPDIASPDDPSENSIFSRHSSIISEDLIDEAERDNENEEEKGHKSEIEITSSKKANPQKKSKFGTNGEKLACWTKNRYMVTFIGSIVMIGIFSYFMVWWAVEIGAVIGIPDAVMGLTFLAAGTSVPDLVTSVLVARQGHGDMAVSSSIGSNIFDVLIGLPLPWLCFALYRKEPITVTADTLKLSVLLLVIMLLLVLLTLIYNQWVMTKSLGYSMFVLYFIFVVQDLLRANFDA